MADTLASVQYVSNFTVLKALGSSSALSAAGITNPEPHQLAVRNGMHRIVAEILNSQLATPLATNSFTLTDVYYIFRFGSSATILEPAITSDANGTGRYFMMHNPIAFQTQAPVDPPPTSNFTYVAELSSPARVVTWKSPENLQETPAIEDWVGDTTPIDVEINNLTELTSFAADFDRQRIRSTGTYLTGIVLEAVDNTPSLPTSSWSWRASIPGNGGTFPDGEDLNGAETIGISSSGFRRKCLANVNLTLPADLVENIESKIAVFDAIAGQAVTLTLTAAASATINGGATVTNITNREVTLSNSGANWYAD